MITKFLFNIWFLLHLVFDLQFNVWCQTFVVWFLYLLFDFYICYLIFIFVIWFLYLLFDFYINNYLIFNFWCLIFYIWYSIFAIWFLHLIFDVVYIRYFYIGYRYLYLLALILLSVFDMFMSSSLIVVTRSCVLSYLEKWTKVNDERCHAVRVKLNPASTFSLHCTYNTIILASFKLCMAHLAWFISLLCLPHTF